MDTRRIGIAGLMLGLSLLGGGATAAGAHAATNVMPASTSIAAPGTGALLDGNSLFQIGAMQTLSQAEDPACAAESADAAEAEDPNDVDNVQDENGADDAAEGDTDADSPADEAAEDARENPDDMDSLQCGDQVEDNGTGQ